MSNSQKGAIWLVLVAVAFLVSCFLGQLATIAVIAMPVARIAVVPIVVGLLGTAVRKRS